MKIENNNFIRSDKFTTIEIYINLLKEFDYSKPYYPLLLSYILNGSSENYPTKDKLSKKIYSLYNACLDISIRSQYECQMTSLYISCLNPKYVNDNSLIHDCVELGYELLYKPFLNKNKDGFDENIFEEKKKRLIALIKNIYNDKYSYGRVKLLEKTRKENELPLTNPLDIKLIEDITNQELYQYYLDLINNSKIIVYAAGDIDKNQIEEELNKFDFKSKNMEIPALYETKNFPIIKENRVEEIQNIAQAKLYMSFRTTINYNDNECVALSIFNLMFGGMFTSSLSQNIREKQSLVYGISSNYNSFRKLIIVRSGNETSKSDHIISEVKKELNNYQSAKILDSQILLERAKESLLFALKEINDDPLERISNLALKSMLSTRTDDQLIKLINEITIEDVIKVSKTIALDTIFILRGEENE